jgi:hypothetical protein
MIAFFLVVAIFGLAKGALHRGNFTMKSGRRPGRPWTSAKARARKRPLPRVGFRSARRLLTTEAQGRLQSSKSGLVPVGSI